MHTFRFKNISEETVAIEGRRGTYAVKPGETVEVQPPDHRHFRQSPAFEAVKLELPVANEGEN